MRTLLHFGQKKKNNFVPSAPCYCSAPRTPNCGTTASPAGTAGWRRTGESPMSYGTDLCPQQHLPLRRTEGLQHNKMNVNNIVRENTLRRTAHTPYTVRHPPPGHCTEPSLEVTYQGKESQVATHRQQATSASRATLGRQMYSKKPITRSTLFETMHSRHTPNTLHRQHSRSRPPSPQVVHPTTAFKREKIAIFAYA